MSTESREKAAIYSRKSKITGTGESIENQIEICKNYLMVKYGRKVSEEALIYEDEGFSGSNLDRPRFKAMMEDISKKNITVIVCYRLDRISRNISDFAGLIESLENINVAFISVKEQFDLSSPMGRAMMYISSVFSQLERETIAERIRDNLYELAKSGRWLGGITPTGYESESVDTITVDGKQKKSHKLKILPDEADLIKKIYAKFLSTESLAETENYLFHNNYKSKNDNYFSRFTIKTILSNPVYMVADCEAYEYFANIGADIFMEESDFTGKYGIMVYNRTLQKKGKAHQVKPADQWIVAIGRHESIIPSADWIRVQNILNINKSKTYRKPRSSIALLSGLLKCKACGSYMRPKLSGRVNRDGQQVYDYICTTKERSKRTECSIKNINGNKLDKAVCLEIAKLSPNNSEFIKQLKNMLKSLSENDENTSNALEQLEQKLSENEEKIKKLINFLIEAPDENIKSRLTEEINALSLGSESLKQKIAEINQPSGCCTPPHTKPTEFEYLLNSFSKTMEIMTVEEKRNLIRTFVKQIEWDGENAHIYFFA
ncbi:recombinase family protein [Tyzzerella sp. OttesenSCG-928-J15]|nr:recombinase family protein [Tyzzerella sp. OttesenSCG-928-J15]